MEVKDLIAKLSAMVAANPKLAAAKVEVEHATIGGCDTCGYGGQDHSDVKENSIYDLDTRLVLSVV